jgi:hypothetical protein
VFRVFLLSVSENLARFASLNQNLNAKTQKNRNRHQILSSPGVFGLGVAL